MAKKSTKSVTKKSLKKKSTGSKDGEIKEASIAKFMRKRTQLVGFDYGHFKHTQYAVEFVDNSMDAIEKFQWDRKRGLQDIRNNMERVNFEFSMYDNDAINLNNLVEEGGKESVLVKKLNQIVAKSSAIFEKITLVNDNLNYLMCIDENSTKERVFKTACKKIEEISINKNNIEEDLKNFLKQYSIIKNFQHELSIKIEKLEENPFFMFTLNKELFLENLSEKRNGLKFSSSESIEEETTTQSKLDESQKEVLKTLLNGSSTENSNVIMDKSEKDALINEHRELENGSLDSNKGDSYSKTSSSSLESFHREMEKDQEIDDEEARELRKKIKDDKEKQQEVKNLINSLERFVRPVVEVINNEPIVILKLSEKEAPEVYIEKGEKDSFLYTFEVFDNGTGMKPDDLYKYGKYLASSKSQKLKQTRGSQGFGSPSAFSDSQNTTGRPITVVSKHSSLLYGVGSQFYTTEKNTKVYVIDPVDIPCPFAHGTYCKLDYLNKKYIRGYVDSYIDKAAIMNSHVTVIYIDPYNEVHIYPRRVGFFPKEPKYALPHPSSIKIGDFQDLLRNSENLTVTAFLTDNFVRMSNSLAKAIVDEAEFEIEDRMKYLNLNDGFLSKIDKPDKIWLFSRNEKRIFGRSNKPRQLLVVYELVEQETRDQVWNHMKNYNELSKIRGKNEKKIRSIAKEIEKIQSKLDKSTHKKDDRKLIKQKEKQISQIEKEITSIIKDMHKEKNTINGILKKATFSKEIKDNAIIDKINEIVKELMISKTKPADLTRLQVEYLYMSFKNQKYMSPPTDTAIPVGETALETAIIGQYGLNVSNLTMRYFDDPSDKITQIDGTNNLSVDEKISKCRKTISKFSVKDQTVFNKSQYINFVSDADYNNKNIYEEILEKIEDSIHYGDDFVASNTRRPTSGKGLAFVVEAVMAYSKNIPSTKKAAQVVTRYVNRTPKLRDNSDCALWMGIQSVNWKNYKVSDTFDNGIPKGNYVIFINCSGPYTHLMFKSQSKNALAEDEVLLKEVKQCMEVIGRKLRKYLSRKERREQRKKRSKTIEKNIPLFINSLYNIAGQIGTYNNLKKADLEGAIREALARDTEEKKNAIATARIKKSLIAESSVGSNVGSENSSVKTLKEETKNAYPQKKFLTPSVMAEVINSKDDGKEKKKQSTLNITQSKSEIETDKPTSGDGKSISYEITSQNVVQVLSDNKWHSIEDLIKRFKITDMQDSKFLMVILKKLYLSKKITAGKRKNGQKVWKIKSE